MFRSLRTSALVANACTHSARRPLVIATVAACNRGGIARAATRKGAASNSPLSNATTTAASCCPSTSSRPHLLDTSCRATADDEPSPPPPSSASSSSSVDLLGSVVALALWAAFLAYALKFSPNQTPARDLYFIQKLVPGAGAADDGVPVNSVFYALFNAMGVMPALYASVLIPAARTGGGGGKSKDLSFPPRLPAWPFVAGSFALGFFALGPYLALWTPAPPVASEEEKGGPRDATAPPSPLALEKSGKLGSIFLKALESPITSAVLFVAAAAQFFIAATAGEEQWVEFLRLFDESRFVHVTSLDFCTLSALLPFWVSNDASARKFDGGKGGTLAAALASFPLIGPALYLVLRPKAQWGRKEEE